MTDTCTTTRFVLNESAFLDDMTKPSLHALSYALRHPDTWPRGFSWNYRNCNRCAMGLAGLLWESLSISGDDYEDAVSDVARGFALPYCEARSMFLGDGTWAPRSVKGHLWWKESEINFAAVTPEMVADQIDAYLERAE